MHSRVNWLPSRTKLCVFVCAAAVCFSIAGGGCGDDDEKQNPDPQAPYWTFFSLLPGLETYEGLDLTVHAAAPGEFWLALREGGVLRYYKNAWSFWGLPGEIHGLYAETADRAWVSVSDGDPSGIYLFNGFTWDPVYTITEVRTPGGLDFYDANHGIVAALEERYPGLYVYNGSAWGFVACACYGHEVDMVSPTVAFVRGEGGDIFRYDAGTVTEYNLPVGEIYDLEMVSPQLGWACCGDAGLYRFDGESWTADPFLSGSTPERSPRGASFVSDTRGWITVLTEQNWPATGTNRVYRYESGTFYEEPMSDDEAPTPGPYVPIDMADGQTGFLYNGYGLYKRVLN